MKLATYDTSYTDPLQAVKDYGLFICTNGKQYFYGPYEAIQAPSSSG